MASILMRQTNVIWLVMLFGRYVLIHAVKNALRKKQKRKIELRISEEVKKVSFRYKNSIG